MMTEEKYDKVSYAQADAELFALMEKWEKENAEARAKRQAEYEAEELEKAKVAESIREMELRKAIRDKRWKCFWGILANLLYIGALFVLIWAVGFAVDAGLIAEVVCTGVRLVMFAVVVVCAVKLAGHIWGYTAANEQEHAASK
ncbi:MAG: hypothetical protein LUH03_09795 [Oscillospiraceae bacterium]|nr:hypothetical protein [Oscillospiraceae bacterium]